MHKLYQAVLLTACEIFLLITFTFTFLLRAHWRIRLQCSVATPSGLLQLVLLDSMMTIPCCFFPFQLFFSS